MNWEKKILLSFLSISFILFSCSDKNSESLLEFNFQQVDTLSLDTSNYSNIIIENSGPEYIKLYFQINGKFWFTSQQIVESIYDVKTDNIYNLSHPINQAWTFVMQNTWHYQEVYLDKTYNYSPLYFINSIGGGVCANRNAVLSLLWRELGYNSHCIYLNGHLVSEVEDNGSWKMLDADYNRYFINSLNKIVCVENLEDSIKYFTSYYNKFVPNNQLYSVYKTDKYYNFFTTKADNVQQEWYEKDILFNDEFISLPKGSRIELPVDNPEDTISSYAYGCLSISGNYCGFVHIPFVVHHVENAVRIRDDNSENNDKSFNNPGDYFLLGTDIIVYYYVNPLLIQWQKQNLIQIWKDSDRHLNIFSEKIVNNREYLNNLKKREDELKLANQYGDFLIDYYRLKSESKLYYKINSTKDLKKVLDLIREKFSIYSFDEQSINSNLKYISDYISESEQSESYLFEELQEENNYYEFILYILIMQTDDFKKLIDEHLMELQK